MTNWHRKTIGELCSFSNGHGFTPRDWAKQGWPIIRIQNLNGSKNFNYFDGEPDPDWIVEPGDLLFAWAGVAGVSFGPTIWSGPRGVLNQHIYRITPHAGIDKDWLYAALKVVTSRIERKAHGFKSSLLHVKKSDITDQHIYMPIESEQKEISRIISVSERLIDVTERLIVAKQEQRTWLMQRLLTGKRRLPGFGKPALDSGAPEGWQTPKTDTIFKNISKKNCPEETVLSVTQDAGVVARDSLDRKINMSHENTHTYKLVEPGDFVISLRSFQGGLEYSRYRGLVSPAYHVIRPKVKISDDFFRIYFKSSEFIQRLAIATIGIRDGKQISFEDFAFMKIPAPPLDEQRKIAAVIDSADRELDLLRAQLGALLEQKKGLMQQLLTGKVRVKV